MLAFPGSLLWLFFLVYFVCSQNLDITSLISNNSNTTKKEIDELAKAFNITIIQSHEEEKENKTSEMDNKKQHSQDTNQWDFTINKTSTANSHILLDNLQQLNTTTPAMFLERSNRRRTTYRTSNASNAPEIPTISQERRNSYLSIAERRKYYNRTRVHTKKLHLPDVELENQETTNKLIASLNETLQLNEIQEIKKSVTKESIKEVITEKTQTNSQRTFADFFNNDTQGKSQSVRQSVIQSQYQFGQKLNFRKPVSRAQDPQEERLRRKKEKMKAEFNIENNTNNVNKNYPTQSTKLIKVDKNLWETTTIPQANAENKNFVQHSPWNGTVLEKLVDYVTSNHTKIETFSNQPPIPLDHHGIEKAVNKNQTKVAEKNFLSPLPLNNINVVSDGKNLSKTNSHEDEKILIQNIYNQEILKLNNLTLNQLDEVLVQNFFNYTRELNNTKNTRAYPTTETTMISSNVPPTIKTTDLSKNILNTTYGANFSSSTTPLNTINEKFSTYEVTQSPVSKLNFTEKRQTTTPLVEAIYKEPSDSGSKTRFYQNETNIMESHKVFPTKIKENRNNESLDAEEEVKSRSETEKYPLTIELNENNKRVLSEMFQTQTTPKPKQETKEEINTSQPTLQHISRNITSTESPTTTSTTIQSNTKTVLSTMSTTITTILSTVINNSSTTTTTEDPQVLPPDDYQEDHKAQGTRYSTKFYISPKLNGTHIIKVVEEDDDDVDDVDVRSRSAGVAIYVLAAFGLIPLLLALVFGTKFVMQRNQREYECESDAKSDISANDSQPKEGKKKKGSTDLKKSPSNVTTITLVTHTRLPRVQHWENSEKQGNRNWEFPRSKLKLKAILGQGNFGQVWKAEAEDMPGHEGVTRLVAVKTVKEGATEKEHTEFIKELEIMQQIGSHPNIVTLLGCCSDQEPYYLIMEYVKYGKLLTYLREHRINENYYNFSSDSNALTSRDLTVFAYCVARGMEYLASRGIIHRDLAARNVLVDHNKICKIADFGMSRSVRDFENGQVYEERQQKGALPIRWMAPESLVYSVFTYKSDVWSFGIVMWEIVTLGSTPYPNMGAREVMRRVRDGYRLERPSHCKPEFYRLISYCWAHDPNKRPDFSELRHELSNLLDNPTKDGSYVDLDRFAVDNSFHVSSKTSDFRIIERNDFRTLQKLGDWNKKDWPDDIRKFKLKRGKNDGKGTVTLTGQGSFTVNSRILEKEFKII